MTHELILTSVSQGLEPDGEGFCVVAASRGIPPALVKRLGPLSEYRHLFSPGSEEAREHPVVYSHLIVPTPETTWHVLSRVADTGIDYRHEPNRLAHHVALREEEFVEEGPAWLLGLPEFHFTEWITPSVRFEMGRLLPTLIAPPPLTRRQRIARQRAWLDPRKMSTSVPPPEDTEKIRERLHENEEQFTLSAPPTSPCPLWRTMTGDAGWGGVLAETVRTGRQTVVLFQPGMNLLPLFVEALALLPSPLFWKATFSTYFTKLPEHVPCQWKGVLAGSPEAQAFLADPNLLVIDLSRPSGPAPPGPYVEYARQGLENLLPENEIDETLFQSDDFDTKTYFTTSDSEATEGPKSEAEPDGAPTPSIFPSPGVPDMEPIENKTIPPIITTDESIRIRPMPSKKSRGLFGSFLNMKSRSRFYLLYGVTLLVVLVLLALVLDQFADLGLARWLRGTTATAPMATDKVRPAKTTASETESSSKLDETSIQREQNRIKKERQNQALAAKRRQRELLARAEQARKDIRDRTIKTREELNDFLLDFSAPKFLPLYFPEEEKLLETLPMQPFAELAPLYRFGSALQMNVLPLQEHPKVRVETKKLDFFQETPPESVDAPAAGETGRSKLGAAEPINSEPPEEEEPDLRIPDTTRFEWRVVAVDTDTEHETPMFHLRLTPQGLYMNWEKDGLAPRHRNDTLRTSLGFLRFCVAGERNMTKIKSAALLRPKAVRPVYFSERFVDPEKREFAVETPFAWEPWKTLFEESGETFSFQLETTVVPEYPSGVRGIVVRDDLPASRFFADFETEISSRKTVGIGRDEFQPVAIPFEGVAEPDRIVWADRYDDRIRLLEEELEGKQKGADDMQKELDALRRKTFTASATDDQQKRQRELQSEIRTLNSRIDEIKDILEKLPSAHEKIVGNKELRFDFSLSLVPRPSNGAGATEDRPRLRNEEALLILTTSEKTEKPAPVEIPSEKSMSDEESE